MKEEASDKIRVDVNTNKFPPIKGIRLNIGSGRDYKEEFINIDKYDATADANWDVENLPLRDRSVAQIVLSDVLEHFGPKQALAVLQECFRVLKLDGQLIIIVPDIVDSCRQVIEHPEDDWMLAHLYGHQQHEGQTHRTGFTVKRLSNMLGFAGFDRLVLCYYTGKDMLQRIYCEAYKR